MKRVLLVGSPGAGKSTFARGLRDCTGLPLHYLDRIWHRPDRTCISREEFDLRLGELLQGERWILDGNYRRTLGPRLEACDTVFFLDIPLEDCLSGVESRIGKPREDMPWVETALDPEFREYILAFHRTQLPELRALLEKYREKGTLIRFASRREGEKYLAHLQESPGKETLLG